MVAQATEGVWGLACDASNREAVARLIALKGRSADQGFIVVLASGQHAQPALAGLTTRCRDEILASWPGHCTWLVPDTQNLELSELVKGYSGKIALRVPDHDQMQRLLEACGLPLVSTSANPSGRPAARTALRVRQYFRDTVDMLLPGKLGVSAGPSEIRDAETGEVLRAGGGSRK